MNSEDMDSRHKEIYAIEKSINALKMAQNDTEKLAALLVVAKLTATPAMEDPLLRRKVFDAIGFNFLNRLLKTKKAEDLLDYKSLVFTLLTCFSTDFQLVLHPNFIDKVEIFNKIITAKTSIPNEVESKIKEDSYTCLFAIGNTLEGQGYLIDHGTVPALCCAIWNSFEGHERSLQLLLQLCQYSGERIWVLYKKEMYSTLEMLAREFYQSKDETKFEICDYLIILLSCNNLHKSTENNEPWSKNINKGLSDILKSKISPKHRISPLQLLSLMVDFFYISWILGPSNRDTKFFLIVVNLVCIEVRMNLETCNVKEINTKGPLLSACYSILEHSIHYLVSSEALDLESQHTSQLISAMAGGFQAILGFLHFLSTTEDECHEGILFSTIKILGVWLSEENLFLNKEVEDILPYLIKVCEMAFSKYSKKQDKSLFSTADLLSCLLPGFFQLVTEDSFRKIMIECMMHDLLKNYFIYYWNQILTDDQIASTKVILNYVVGLLLHFTVHETKLCTTPVFIEILQLIISDVSFILERIEVINLLFHLIGLGVLLLQHNTKNLEISSSDSTKFFLTNVVRYLKKVHTININNHSDLSQDFCKFWPDIKDVWHLIMQGLSDCIKDLSWIVDIIQSENWIIYSVKLLQAGFDDNDDDISLKYREILIKAAKLDQICFETIKQEGGTKFLA